MSSKIIVTIDSDLKEIVPTFLENRNKDLIQIEDFLTQSNWESIESIAHKLAGNAGSYGFNELGEIGANLEEACKSANVTSIHDYCTKYQDYMENLQVEFN